MVRITIVHQGALGDTILLLPLFRSLRLRFPESQITLITKTNLGQMFNMLGFIETYASADDRDHTLWFADPRNDRSNSSPAWSACDVLISAVSSGSDAWARNARLAAPAAALHCFEPRPPKDFPGHVTAFHRRQLTALNLPEAPLPLLRSNPDGAVVIHPGSGGDAKCWPREKFLTLGRDLKRNGILPTFILGEVEQDKWGHAEINALKDEFPWYLHMGLYELAEKMSRARLYVGNDSGVSHIAAAMGVPTLTLFGPSNDTQWRPVGPAVKILRAPAPNESTLAAIEVQTVLNEVLAELRKL